MALALGLAATAAAKPSVRPLYRFWAMLTCGDTCRLQVAIADRWGGVAGPLYVRTWVAPVSISTATALAVSPAEPVTMVVDGEETVAATWTWPRGERLQWTLETGNVRTTLALTEPQAIVTCSSVPSPPSGGVLSWPPQVGWEMPPRIDVGLGDHGAAIVAVQAPVALRLWLLDASGAPRCAAAPPEGRSAWLWPRSFGDPLIWVAADDTMWWATLPLAELIE